MKKVIALRGKRELVALFHKYATISGNQNKGRPQAIVDFINYVAGLSDEEAKAELRAAARTPIDVSDIESTPASMKIEIDSQEIEESWQRAITLFKQVFDLKTAPQMPYFIRVSGVAMIKSLEKQNEEQKVIAAKNVNLMDIEAFKGLVVEDRLVEIYKVLNLLLIEKGGYNI